MNSVGDWSRREFLGMAGVVMVCFALPIRGASTDDDEAGAPDAVDPKRLDSWLAVTSDGNVLASVGKIEAGMGVSTAFAQVVAEELDVPLNRVSIRMGDTATTVDQRGTGSSNGIVEGVPALRQAAAEARHELLSRAAALWNVPLDTLVVRDGMVSVEGVDTPVISYGELVAGNPIALTLRGGIQVKKPTMYKWVGKSVPRIDIPLKASGAYEYLVDLKVPGMLHARVLRPPRTGAHLEAFGDSTQITGLRRIVRRGDFVAVVCDEEYQAVCAARELHVRWTKGEPLFPDDYDALYGHLRTEPVQSSETEKGGTGEVDAALAQSTVQLEALYEYPFQSHACMGPACGVADVRKDEVTVWMGGQKPYPLRKAVANLLGWPEAKVRVIWLPGPGSYGMNDADDAAIDAVLLSRELGQPVRVQYMRHDATAWDPKGPPLIVQMRGGLDASGRVQAFDYEARGFSGRVRPSSTSQAGDSLSGQLIGGYTTKSTNRFQFSTESYVFPHKRKVSHLIRWEQSLPTGLRTAHLRDPDGMATCFASECFIDELAAAAHEDPVTFRLNYLTDPRDRAAIEAVAERAGWEARPSPLSGQTGPIVKGRGIAYAPRNGTVVAIVAEVLVNLNTGDLRVTRFVVAHDCGFVVNPLSLVGTIEANLIQGTSRALHEAVQFSASEVTSVDWATYPILDVTELPDSVDIVMLNNRPDAKSRGAGEPATRPVAAVIANALYDATGVRVRRVPFTRQALKAAFAAAAANSA
jgi:nicotinate dehydrogenase subunit B